MNEETYTRRELEEMGAELTESGTYACSLDGYYNVFTPTDNNGNFRRIRYNIRAFPESAFLYES